MTRGPYFWIAFILATFFGAVIGNAKIDPFIGIPLIIAAAWLGGRFAARCDFDRDHNNRH